MFFKNFSYFCVLYFLIMRIFFTLIVLCLTTAGAMAQTIDCKSGQLSSLVTDKTVTSLTVTGTMNAVDFKFIADDLTALTSIDLSGVEITAYESETRLFGNVYEFAANTLPNGCFAGSKLTTATLPQTITAIGEGAFFVCDALTDITLPASLDSIGDYAFSYCTGLAEITIPASVRVIGTGAFSQCTALANVGFDNSSSDISLTIGDNAFEGCTAITAISIPKRTNSIGSYAFANCSNTEFAPTFAEDCALSQLGESAFMASAIKAFDFSTCPDLKAIPAYAFASSSLASVAAPAAISNISEGAFFNNQALTSIELNGTNAASISKLQFANCPLAQSTGINDETSEIGEYAYYGWNQTQQLTIPANVSYIGDYAFGGMTALAKITSMPLTAPELGGEAVFYGITPSDVKLRAKYEATDYDLSTWAEFTRIINGDANESNTLTVTDIANIISQIKGVTPTNTFSSDAADFNLDGVIDDDDLNSVISVIKTVDY